MIEPRELLSIAKPFLKSLKIAIINKLYTSEVKKKTKKKNRAMIEHLLSTSCVSYKKETVENMKLQMNYN